MNELPELMTVKELRDYLKCSNKNVYNLIKTDGFPCLKVGGSYRICKNEFIEWVNNQRLRREVSQDEDRS